MFAIGARVKPSAYALRPLWERYLSLGDYTQKNRARRYHDEQRDRRGTVTAR